MKTLKLLIDLAREKAHGNEAALARALNVPLHHPHEWRTGKRPLSAETVAAICDYLGLGGEEAREWVAIALIENPKNATKTDMLRRALFACWVAGVATLAALQNDAKATAEKTATTPTKATPGLQLTDHHIAYCRVLRMLARWVSRLLGAARTVRVCPPLDEAPKYHLPVPMRVAPLRVFGPVQSQPANRVKS